MLVSRRGVLAGLGAVLAAPAIVHAGNLMPVRSIERLLQKGPMIRLIATDGVVLSEIPFKPVNGRVAFPPVVLAAAVAGVVVEIDGSTRFTASAFRPTLAAGDTLNISGIPLSIF